MSENIENNKLSFRRPIIEIGNSFGVTIPSQYIENYNLQKGKKYQFYIITEPVKEAAQ